MPAPAGMTPNTLDRAQASARSHLVHANPTRDAGFGIYLHWPFCASKCPYCDFNSHVRHAAIDEARFLRAFRTEMSHVAALTPDREVTSIFLGGGTPSLMQPATVAGLLDAVAGSWRVAPGVEITLEANPTSVEAERFRGYRSAGVNRVSLGVQALNDAVLRALGRMHSATEALAAIDTAAAHFERYSFDLIYARPDQDVASWEIELRTAIEHAAEHLSLYQLTIEPGTPFYGLVQTGRLVPPDDEQARALYDATQEVCAREGLERYEVSNHARPGAASRHNLLYWRYGEYAGIGPGAHGRLVTMDGRVATVTERRPEAWLTTVERYGHGFVETEAIPPKTQADEFLMMGLRLREGVDPGRYASFAGGALNIHRLTELMADGFIERRGHGRIAATPRGVHVLNTVVAQLSS